MQSKGLSRVFSSDTVRKHQLFGAQSFFISSSHIHTRLLEKSQLLTIETSVGQVPSLVFHTLSSFVMAFLPRSKHLFISWLQSPSAVIFELGFHPHSQLAWMSVPTSGCLAFIDCRIGLMARAGGLAHSLSEVALVKIMIQTSQAHRL